MILYFHFLVDMKNNLNIFLIFFNCPFSPQKEMHFHIHMESNLKI